MIQSLDSLIAVNRSGDKFDGLLKSLGDKPEDVVRLAGLGHSHDESHALH